MYHSISIPTAMAALTLLLAGAAAMDTCPGWEVPACSDGTCLHVKEACQGVSLCEGEGLVS